MKIKCIYLLLCLILIVYLTICTVPAVALAYNTLPAALQEERVIFSDIQIQADNLTQSDISTQKDTITILFNPGQGTGSMNRIMADIGSVFTVPKCTFTPPVGKRFQYWSTLLGSFQEEDTLIIPQAIGPLRFTAVWEDIPSEPETGLTMNFAPNGGTGTMAPITVTNGSFTVPKCTFTPPTGKRFRYWSTPIGKFEAGDIINNLEGFTGALFFTAQWEDMPASSGQQTIIITPGQTGINHGTVFQILDPFGYLTSSPLILAARYSKSGQMKELTTGYLTGTELRFFRSLDIGAGWKIFFLNCETYAPLCPAISL